jgi:hypothetical protein
LQMPVAPAERSGQCNAATPGDLPQADGVDQGTAVLEPQIALAQTGKLTCCVPWG